MKWLKKLFKKTNQVQISGDNSTNIQSAGDINTEKNKKDRTLVIQCGDEDIEINFTREEMALLSVEAANYGRSVQDHVQKLLEHELNNSE